MLIIPLAIWIDQKVYDAANAETSTPERVGDEDKQEEEEKEAEDAKADVRGYVNQQTVEQKNTPLHYVAQREVGMHSLANLLLHAGADPLTTNANGQSPIHVACILENHRVVEHLLTGLRVGDPRIDARDRYGRTALDYSSRSTRPRHGFRTFRLLLAHGASAG